jgi:hypothetical protein
MIAGLVSVYYIYFLIFPYLLQSALGRLAIILVISINNMKEIPPIMHLLFNLNHRLVIGAGDCAVY